MKDALSSNWKLLTNLLKEEKTFEDQEVLLLSHVTMELAVVLGRLIVEGELKVLYDEYLNPNKPKDKLFAKMMTDQRIYHAYLTK